jgi:hypothetical protein
VNADDPRQRAQDRAHELALEHEAAADDLGTWPAAAAVREPAAAVDGRVGEDLVQPLRRRGELVADDAPVELNAIAVTLRPEREVPIRLTQRA